ncbi:nucleotide-diphospho-sugar transferase [Chytriomyces sp. MP71]|nr:nucleotide-diphospho-sugar transferase [Chytriomyces sp. MP71]
MLLYNNAFTNPRYLCSIESAIRQNKQWEVTLYAANVSDFLSATQKWFSAAESYNPMFNGKFRVVNLDWPQLFAETPLEVWWNAGTWKDSKWIDQNLGNAARLAILWRNGGVYMDLDLISVSPVGALGRMVAQQSGPSILNNAFFSMEKQDPFVWLMMEEFVSGFEGNIWGRNGPRMVERTYQRHCRNKHWPFKNRKACSIAIAPKQRLYRISYGGSRNFQKPYFKTCNLLGDIADR